jgi:hypothetical protein
MKEISKSTPRTDFVVQKLLLKVPEPFKKGDVLETEGEASSINQTYRENVRNNLAKEIAEMQTKIKDEAGQIAAAQKLVDDYCKTYQFGIRTGGGRSADPVMTVAKALARDIVKEAWKKKGKKSSDYTTAELNDAAMKLIAANKQIRAYAEAEVAAKAKAKASLGTVVVG